MTRTAKVGRFKPHIQMIRGAWHASVQRHSAMGLTPTSAWTALLRKWHEAAKWNNTIAAYLEAYEKVYLSKVPAI